MNIPEAILNELPIVFHISMNIKAYLVQFTIQHGCLYISCHQENHNTLKFCCTILLNCMYGGGGQYGLGCTVFRIYESSS